MISAATGAPVLVSTQASGVAAAAPDAGFALEIDAAIALLASTASPAPANGGSPPLPLQAPVMPTANLSTSVLVAAEAKPAPSASAPTAVESRPTPAPPSADATGAAAAPAAPPSPAAIDKAVEPAANVVASPPPQQPLTSTRGPRTEAIGRPIDKPAARERNLDAETDPKIEALGVASAPLTPATPTMPATSAIPVAPATPDQPRPAAPVVPRPAETSSRAQNAPAAAEPPTQAAPLALAVQAAPTDVPAGVRPRQTGRTKLPVSIDDQSGGPGPEPTVPAATAMIVAPPLAHIAAAPTPPPVIAAETPRQVAQATVGIVPTPTSASASPPDVAPSAPAPIAGEMKLPEDPSSPGQAFTLPLADAAASPAKVTHATTDIPVARAQPGHIGREIGVEIARRVSMGGEELIVRLDPPSLGRVEVRMSFDHQSSLRAVISADNVAALDMLRRDSVDLSRALSDAGVRSDAQTLRFDSRGGHESGGQPRNLWQKAEPDAGPHRGFGAEAEAADIPFRSLRTSGRYDLMA